MHITIVRNFASSLWLGILLLGLGGATSGCGDDEGSGNGASLADRSRTAGLARSRARCQCPGSGYDDLELCAARAAFGTEYNRCNLDAWQAAGVGEEAVACYVAARESGAGCYAAIDGCNEEAVQACDDQVDAAQVACNAAFGQLPPDPYFDALDTCVMGDVVGEATGCAPGEASSEVGTAAFSGTAVGAGDDLQASCETASTADVEHAWTAPTTGRYRFTTDGTSAEVALVVLDACGGAELACDIWNEGEAPNRQSVVELDVDAGTTYVLVVDFLFDSSVGPYQINITTL